MFAQFLDTKFIKLCVKSGLVGMVVSLTVWDKICYFSGVDGVSMQPLINTQGKRGKKDRVFIVRASIFKPVEETVKRGDVISLISPKNFDECFIKRVIGLPGDVVKTISYKKNYVLVPQGHCWIEGDNHNSSYDSNKFGCIPMGLILGKAKIVKTPTEYHGDMIQFTKDFLNGFSWIQPLLPSSRELFKLNKDQGFIKIKNSGDESFFIDFKKKKKGRSCGKELGDNDLSLSKYTILDIVEGELSEEVFNEINSNEDYDDDLNYDEDL